MKYTAWIKARYPTPETAYLKCKEATAAMVADFPELRRIRGNVMVGIQFRPHWWCLTPDGDVIDPTAHQWPTMPGLYDAIPDGAEEPHGKCLECGSELYRSRGAQSYLCEECAN